MRNQLKKWWASLCVYRYWRLEERTYKKWEAQRRRAAVGGNSTTGGGASSEKAGGGNTPAL